MEKKVILVDADRKHCSKLCVILGEGNYRTIPLHSIHLLKESLQERDYMAGNSSAQRGFARYGL